MRCPFRNTGKQPPALSIPGARLRQHTAFGIRGIHLSHAILTPTDPQAFPLAVAIVSGGLLSAIRVPHLPKSLHLARDVKAFCLFLSIVMPPDKVACFHTVVISALHKRCAISVPELPTTMPVGVVPWKRPFFTIVSVADPSDKRKDSENLRERDLRQAEYLASLDLVADDRRRAQ